MTTENTNIVKIKNGRLAFAHGLFEARSVNGGSAKFNCTLILPKDHPQIAEIKAKILEVATAKWGAKAQAILKDSKGTGKYPLHDGDTEKSGTKGYAGNYFINLNSDDRPTLLQRDGKTPVVKGDGILYSGCQANFSTDCWAQDNVNGKRVNFGLRGVMFKADGDKLSGGGGAADVSEFDGMAEGNDDIDDDDLA